MVRQKNSVDDKDWLEVIAINSYAIFMGYLLMGVRGLGVLVLTWTTVVLLGGFVSMLQQKDFWCLTIITLVQTAGVFDFLLKEKASDIANSFVGSGVAVISIILRPFRKCTSISASSSKAIITKKDKELVNARKVVAVVVLVVQMLVLAILLCPLAVLYVLGLYLSAGISLWRLIQHDYGNSSDGGANLKPALNVLYSLAVAQGVVYGYRTIYDLAARTSLVKDVAHGYLIEMDLVSEYLDETMSECMKDPSFARGRNLVTYAVDLLVESKSRHGYISGVLILGKILQPNHLDYEQQGLLKQLLTGSASFSHAVQRLLETFGPTSPYSTEIRVRAATIVATVAGSIRLEQFPDQGMMMIQCVCSLLDTSEYSWRPEGYEGPRTLLEPVDNNSNNNNKPGRLGLPKEYERDWLLDTQELRYSCLDRLPRPRVVDSNTRGSGRLLEQGLWILQGLTVNEDNCRIILSSTQGMLSKAMSPLISDQPHSHSVDHHDHGEEWHILAEESLEVMKRFMATAEDTKTKLPSEMSGYSQLIVSTLQAILDCLKCGVQLKRQAVWVLLDLSIMPSRSSSSSSSSTTMLVWILLHISLLPDYHFSRMSGSTHLAKKSSDIKRLAGEKLKAVLSSQTSSTELQSVGDVIRSLSTAVVAADAEHNAWIRVRAATILRHLILYYTKDDQHLKQLKKTMTDVMPQVLEQIVHWRGSREAGTQAVVTEANNGGKVLQAAGTDLEQGGSSSHHDNGQEESSSTSHQQKSEQHQGIIELQEALVDLCGTIVEMWIDEDQDLTHQFNAIAGERCSGQGMPFKIFVSEPRERLWQEKRAARLAAVRTTSVSKRTSGRKPEA